MHAEKYNPESHYPILAEFWSKHGWPSIPKDHLSQHGIIIKNVNDTIVLAGWVYYSGCAFGLLEWILANPEIKGLERDLAFDIFKESVVNYSKELGIKTLVTSVHNTSLISRLKKLGVVESDTNMTNMVWRI